MRRRFWTTAVALLVGCVDPGAPSNREEPAFAKGGGGSPTVTSTVPDSAVQDTTLDVAVLGSGYDRGSRADFALSGVVDPGNIRTNSTRFVNQGQVVANITIAATAPIASYDVIVTTSTGRKGIGTELFAVKAATGNATTTDPRANLVWADQVDIGTAGAPNVVPAGIRGDGRLKDGSSATGTPSNEYQAAFCGVAAWLAAAKTQSGDMPFDPDVNYTSSMRPSCGAPRYYNFYLSSDPNHLNPSALQSGPRSTAFGLANLGPGASVIQAEGFGIGQPNCPILMFDDAFPPANSLRYTRLADSTTSTGSVRRWQIASRGSHTAACVSPGHKAGTYVPNGISYFVPFALMVTEIPYPYPTFP